MYTKIMYINWQGPTDNIFYEWYNLDESAEIYSSNTLARKLTGMSNV